MKLDLNNRCWWSKSFLLKTFDCWTAKWLFTYSGSWTTALGWYKDATMFSCCVLSLKPTSMSIDFQCGHHGFEWELCYAISTREDWHDRMPLIFELGSVCSISRKSMKNRGLQELMCSCILDIIANKRFVWNPKVWFETIQNVSIPHLS